MYARIDNRKERLSSYLKSQRRITCHLSYGAAQRSTRTALNVAGEKRRKRMTPRRNAVRRLKITYQFAQTSALGLTGDLIATQSNNNLAPLRRGFLLLANGNGKGKAPQPFMKRAARPLSRRTPSPIGWSPKGQRHWPPASFLRIII